MSSFFKLVSKVVGQASSFNQAQVLRGFEDQAEFQQLQPRQVITIINSFSSPYQVEALNVFTVYPAILSRFHAHDIAELVKGGLGARVQKSLDVVRVIGNNSVHPGQMAIEDNPAVVATLFKLVNVIVDVLISQPRHLSEAYSDLPENARKAIEKRDGG